MFSGLRSPDIGGTAPFRADQGDDVGAGLNQVQHRPLAIVLRPDRKSLVMWTSPKRVLSCRNRTRASTTSSGRQLMAISTFMRQILGAPGAGVNRESESPGCLTAASRSQGSMAAPRVIREHQCCNFALTTVAPRSITTKGDRSHGHSGAAASGHLRGSRPDTRCTRIVHA
jgi:hypothetical protein